MGFIHSLDPALVQAKLVSDEMFHYAMLNFWYWYRLN